MITRPSGLWPFTELVLDEIEKSGVPVFKLEEHDADDLEGADFIWGELPPHLSLSEGEYLRIDQVGDAYYSELGTRGCCGGDPTFGGFSNMEPSKENAIKVSAEYIEYFTRKD